MSSDADSGPDTRDLKRVSYADSAYEEVLESVMERYKRGDGVGIIFLGGERMQHQEALAELADRAVANVHQFVVPSLVGERRMQTQSSLRKTFDSAAEDEVILFFDHVDMLFDWRHPDTLGGAEEPTSIEYFLQRVEAFRGIVVLGIDHAEHVDTVRRFDMQLLVEFPPPLE